MSVSSPGSPRLALRRWQRRRATCLLSASGGQRPVRYRETTKTIEDWSDAWSICHWRVAQRRDEYFRYASKPASWRHFFTASHDAGAPRRAEPSASSATPAAAAASSFAHRRSCPPRSSKHTVAKRIWRRACSVGESRSTAHVLIGGTGGVLTSNTFLATPATSEYHSAFCRRGWPVTPVSHHHSSAEPLDSDRDFGRTAAARPSGRRFANLSRACQWRIWDLVRYQEIPLPPETYQRLDRPLC